MEQVVSFIDKENELDESTKIKIKKILYKLKESKDFTQDIIIEYTSEDGFVYLFNKIMRRIEDGILQLSFFIGPIYYSLVRFVKSNSQYALKKDSILFRHIVINKIDLNFYEMAKGDIICFPSFSSISFERGFSTTNSALKVNNVELENIQIEMIIQYNHCYYNLSPGIILGNLSYFKNEKEVLLFPFTFIKVQSISKIIIITMKYIVK